MKTFLQILKEHISYRRQLVKLAKAELIKTYKGSALGWSWAFVKPSIQMFVYWFAFSVGLRGGSSVEGFPYFLWLLSGIVPWFFMADMLLGGAGSFRRHTYLITKIKYPISTIPTFVCMSYFLIHLGLLAATLIIFAVGGFYPDMYYLQLPFYMLMMFLFFTAWGLFSGLLSAMSRDFMNLVRSITTAMFWMSGVIFDVNRIDIEWIRTILLFNPITLIVNGYRNCFIYKQWLWETPQETFNLCLVMIIMMALATWAYKKLRKEIPDVL